MLNLSLEAIFIFPIFASNFIILSRFTMIYLKRKTVGALIELLIVEHEMNAVAEFSKNPGEDVASVSLEVGGVEHLILMNEQDFPRLVSFLNEIVGMKNERAIERLNQIKTQI